MIAKTKWCMSKGMICELQCEKVVGRGRRTTDEEQVLQWVWTEVNLHRYIGRMVVRTLCESDRCLYLMHSLILNQWRKRIYNRNDTRVFRFRSFNSGMCKWVLSLSKSVYLRLQKIVAYRIAVVKFDGGSNDTGSFFAYGKDGCSEVHKYNNC